MNARHFRGLELTALLTLSAWAAGCGASLGPVCGTAACAASVPAAARAVGTTVPKGRGMASAALGWATALDAGCERGGHTPEALEACRFHVGFWVEQLRWSAGEGAPLAVASWTNGALATDDVRRDQPHVRAEIERSYRRLGERLADQGADVRARADLHELADDEAQSALTALAAEGAGTPSAAVLAAHVAAHDREAELRQFATLLSPQERLTRYCDFRARLSGTPEADKASEAAWTLIDGLPPAEQIAFLLGAAATCFAGTPHDAERPARATAVMTHSIEAGWNVAARPVLEAALTAGGPLAAETCTLATGKLRAVDEGHRSAETAWIAARLNLCEDGQALTREILAAAEQRALVTADANDLLTFLEHFPNADRARLRAEVVRRVGRASAGLSQNHVSRFGALYPGDRDAARFQERIASAAEAQARREAAAREREEAAAAAEERRVAREAAAEDRRAAREAAAEDRRAARQSEESTGSYQGGGGGGIDSVQLMCCRRCGGSVVGANCQDIPSSNCYYACAAMRGR